MKKFLITALVFTQIVSPVPARAVTETSSSGFQCRVEIDNAHISTQLVARKYTKVVKINARSICNEAIHNLELQVDIYKVGIPVTHLVKSFKSKIYPVVEANKVIKFENAYVACKTSKSTAYFGLAMGKAIIRGHLNITRAGISPKLQPLPCGT